MPGYILQKLAMCGYEYDTTVGVYDDFTVASREMARLHYETPLKRREFPDGLRLLPEHLRLPDRSAYQLVTSGETPTDLIYYRVLNCDICSFKTTSDRSLISSVSCVYSAEVMLADILRFVKIISAKMEHTKKRQQSIHKILAELPDLTELSGEMIYASRYLRSLAKPIVSRFDEDSDSDSESESGSGSESDSESDSRPRLPKQPLCAELTPTELTPEDVVAKVGPYYATLFATGQRRNTHGGYARI